MAGDLRLVLGAGDDTPHDALADWLDGLAARARAGELLGAAVVLVQRDRGVVTDWFAEGDIGLSVAAGVSILSYRVCARLTGGEP